MTGAQADPLLHAAARQGVGGVVVKWSGSPPLSPIQMVLEALIKNVVHTVSSSYIKTLASPAKENSRLYECSLAASIP